MMITSKEELEKGIKSVLISAEEIQEAVKNAAALIDREYQGKPLLLVSILKGAFVFLADLMKNITVPCEVAFMAAESYYEGTSSSGEVKITLDVKQDLSRYNVLIVEDIIDTGRTLKDVTEMLRKREPLSLRIITLLDKPERRVADLEPDWTLFTIPDKFVIGYGLDHGEYYRNLPYVGELAPQ